MGMFDEIKNILWCPFCGVKQKSLEFQTKDFGCSLKPLDIFKIKGVNYSIFQICPNCDNDINLQIDDLGVHTVKTGKKEIEKRKKTRMVF